MHLQAVASAFLIVFLCQHDVLVSGLLSSVGTGLGTGLDNTLNAVGQDLSSVGTGVDNTLNALGQDLSNVFQQLLGPMNLPATNLPATAEQLAALTNCILRLTKANNRHALQQQVDAVNQVLTLKKDQLNDPVMAKDQQGVANVIRDVVETKNLPATAEQLAAELFCGKDATNANNLHALQQQFGGLKQALNVDTGNLVGNLLARL